MRFHGYVYGPRRGPLPLTMEQLAERWSVIPGFFFEWDGSFTWANASEGWTLEGNVYDDGQCIQYVDLHAIDRSECTENGQTSTTDPFLRHLDLFFKSLMLPADELTVLSLPQMVWQDLQDFGRSLHED